MTDNRQEKRLARERMIETDQSYTAALRDVRAAFQAELKLREARESTERSKVE